MIADNEIDIAASRALIWRGLLGARPGSSRPSQSTSIAKIFAAEAVYRVVDRSMQMCGALGVSGDAAAGPAARARCGRSGSTTAPSEIHRWAIAQARGAAKRPLPRR